MSAFTLRIATSDDLAAVDALLGRSYPRLLARDYPRAVMDAALPVISRARPELLVSGRYLLALDAGGRVVGAGGFSSAAPSGGSAPQGDGVPEVGHVRHVATDPDCIRQGVGRALMNRIFAEATSEGMRRMECLSTRTAVAFYAAMGFRVVAPVDVPLGPGIVFPAVQMIRDL